MIYNKVHYFLAYEKLIKLMEVTLYSILEYLTSLTIIYV